MSLNLGQITANLVDDSPKILYHGSGWLATELKPGYIHTKKVICWDAYESNTFLYATSDMENAKLLGISSAWNRYFDIELSKFNRLNKTIELEFDGDPEDKEVLLNTEAYLYSFKNTPGVWIRNNNPHNNIDGEYKTGCIITSILSTDRIDVKQVLSEYSILIK